MLISIDKNRAILFIKSYLKFCNLTTNFLMGKHRKFRGNLSKIQMRSQKSFCSHMMWQFFFIVNPHIVWEISVWSIELDRYITHTCTLFNKWFFFENLQIWVATMGFNFLFHVRSCYVLQRKKNILKQELSFRVIFF